MITRIDIKDIRKKKHNMDWVPYPIAAEILQVSVTTIRKMIEGGSLKAQIICSELTGKSWKGVLWRSIKNELIKSDNRENEELIMINDIDKMLEETGRLKTTITYSEIMHPLNLDHSLSNDRYKLGCSLLVLAKESLNDPERGFMITALAVLKKTGKPNDKFFEIAQMLDAMKPNESREDFFKRQIKSIYDFYSKKN
ncbi:hypothetical protein [Endozoicomonas euniceicola]|uniref:Helix-turn-helix domain-containing protein n=1 Tax=Endozoicomonas euniceicola TaxID=1234143 RepID=A0ABY6GW47_9GAMM|nr:hypothetical protein [Endozoicomonas euniceicola]UYM16316.1 hypothetical protein NX720_26570 [Endozoicomonas euniceicola]